MSLEDLLCNIIKEVLENKQINNSKIKEGQLSSLGLNSILFIKMVVKIESEFNIEFDDGMLQIDKLNTLEDLSKYVQSKIDAGKISI